MATDKPFKRIRWQRAARLLAQSLGDYFDTAKARVELGLEHIYCVKDYSVCLLRAEGRELVVVGFTGKGRLFECAPLIAQKAKVRGFSSIRVHTKRKGECRFLNKHGLAFEVVEHRDNGEFVLRLEL
ncbi:hypothetical protein [Vibrio cholerae]|uniref:hypothetical protein n=1 Tax=Vibrio cholerae TaxID=666 RepID=UPI00115A70F3|nr:hypothetical protein [Vibrio cholerae]EGR0786358.1 hypothetical protein [Vibrio cholerae]EGR0836112.1 hypothetical protein [Vibrio cholerae]EGR1056940.1 hypothetical protein [Vibrio cholerae]EJL6462810.1 hypothetical protein [Vibrio cholerae]EJL6487764.1 hypothetical protein [Vibrio cholerae]